MNLWLIILNYIMFGVVENKSHIQVLISFYFNVKKSIKNLSFKV